MAGLALHFIDDNSGTYSVGGVANIGYRRLGKQFLEDDLMATLQGLKPEEVLHHLAIQARFDFGGTMQPTPRMVFLHDIAPSSGDLATDTALETYHAQHRVVIHTDATNETNIAAAPFGDGAYLDKFSRRISYRGLFYDKTPGRDTLPRRNQLGAQHYLRARRKFLAMMLFTRCK